MAKRVVTVMPGTGLKEVARLLVERRISGVPVVDGDGRVLGVVSESDILEKERHPPPKRPRFFGRRSGRGQTAKHEAQTAAEAMTSPAVTISPFVSVAEAASVMAERGVDRLVVCEHPLRALEEERLVGIVTRGDLVRAFARSDKEIEREIRLLVEHDFGLLPGEVRARVERGDVTLEGDVHFKVTAESLEALVAQVPGVVSIHSKLTWKLEKPFDERWPALAPPRAR